MPIFLAKTDANTSERWECLIKGLSKTTFGIREVPKKYFVGVTNNKHWTFAPEVLSDPCSYHSTISHDRTKTDNALYPNPLIFPCQFIFFLEKDHFPSKIHQNFKSSPD